jgi:hypothetical protein
MGRPSATAAPDRAGSKAFRHPGPRSCGSESWHPGSTRPAPGGGARRSFARELSRWRGYISTASAGRLREWAPALVLSGYGAALAVLGAVRADHLLLGGLSLVVYHAAHAERRMFSFLFPAILTGVIYDSQRFWGNLLRARIRVSEPYQLEQALFGIPTDRGTLTPNEWLQRIVHPALDLVTGFAYLTFIGVFIATAAYFVFWIRKSGSARVMWACFWLNCLGFSTYYWYPAAPPWYLEAYGLGPARLDVPPSIAGCLRFDGLLGISLFGNMYARAAVVFGAIPSLHVAYPLLTACYAFQLGHLRAFSVFFYLLMCFSAVYLNHHYVLDLVWGSVYAIVIYGVVEAVGRRGAVIRSHG